MSKIRLTELGILSKLSDLFLNARNKNKEQKFIKNLSKKDFLFINELKERK